MRGRRQRLLRALAAVRELLRDLTPKMPRVGHHPIQRFQQRPQFVGRQRLAFGCHSSAEKIAEADSGCKAHLESHRREYESVAATGVVPHSRQGPIVGRSGATVRICAARGMSQLPTSGAI